MSQSGPQQPVQEPAVEKPKAQPERNLSFLRSYFLPALIWLAYQPLRLSWRLRVIEPEPFKAALASGRPLVLAHWHGDELGVIYLLKRYRASAMTSTSKDGELINGVLRMMGVKTARGSSTRGGVGALKGILRLASEGYRPSVAVDGPKGPYHKVKPGIFEISKITGGEIFPIAVKCSRAFIFQRAWNKAYLPLPFARIVVVWGESVPALARGQDAHAPELAQRLETSMTDAGRKAANLIAGSLA
jgi:lysophospholipid acyltransferase (LPLAT)-like uncharacterized protein